MVRRQSSTVASKAPPSAPAAPLFPSLAAAPHASAASAPPAPPVPVGDEAYRVLLGLAHRRSGRIPADVLVRQAMRAGAGGGWAVEKAAFEAVLRRIALFTKDRLVVAKRPRGPFGLYATKRARGAARPYDTRLDGIDPLRASCACDDFVRSSLGVCKHVIAVLDDIAKKPRSFEAARRAPPSSVASPRWTWNPIRPLFGLGDWIEGLRLVGRVGARGREGVPDAWKGLLVPSSDDPGALVPRPAAWADPSGRASLLATIERTLGTSRGARERADAEPAVRTLVADDLRRLAARHDDPAWLRSALASLRTLKRPLYPYQRVGVERFLTSGHLLLADDMGLGKTAQAIASCHALFATRRVRRGLLIVPASLKGQWAREWAQFTDTPLTVVEGDPSSRAATYRSTKAGFLVANYEQVLRDLDLMQAFDPDLVVLDEAQRIKNFAAKTAVFVKQLAPRLRLVLTGTPMENRLEELSSLLDWVDDRALEPIWRLGPWHASYDGEGRDAKGVRHLDTLRTRLAGCLLRRVRHEVLAQLPPRTDTRIPVELTEEQRDEHDALTQPIRVLMSTAERRPLTQPEFLRLMSLLTTQRVIANGIAQLRFEARWPSLRKLDRPDEGTLASLGAPKLGELREIFGQVVVGQRRKTVVFSQWTRMLRLAHWATRDVLEDAGVRAVFFTGREGSKERERNLVDFHDDPEVRVLFASDAGGVGLNLQRAASCCVNLELPWNPAVLEQRIGRIHRMGQTKPIDVYALVSQACIEERIAELVGNKQALFTGLFDGTADEVRFERSGSFMSRLERLVAPAPASASAPVRGRPASDAEDDAPEPARALDDAIDEVVEAAEEGKDAAQEAVAAGLGERGASRGDAVVRASEGTREGVGPGVGPGAPTAVGDLLAQVSFIRSADGGVRIEAPREAAATLAALFAGMADLLRQSAVTPPR